jgi:hypothetical protein
MKKKINFLIKIKEKKVKNNEIKNDKNILKYENMKMIKIKGA